MTGPICRQASAWGPRSSGGPEAAAAWIAAAGERGGFSRHVVLDGPMLARGRGFRTALDVGCGERRFFWMLQGRRIRSVGIEPDRGAAAAGPAA